MIIDGHTHISTDKPTAKSASILLESMREAGVVKSVVLPIPGKVSNKAISGLCSAHLDKLIGFGWGNPNEGARGAKKTLCELETLSLQGLKLHPRIQGFDFKDRHVIEFFKELDKHKELVIIMDCWFSDKDDAACKEMMNFVASMKKTKIILAHAGGFQYNKIIPFASKKNIFLDISYTLHAFEKHSKIDNLKGFMVSLKKIPSSKIIFGSDFPECDILESIKLSKKWLMSGGFDSEELDRIYVKNIKRVLDIR